MKHSISHQQFFAKASRVESVATDDEARSNLGDSASLGGAPERNSGRRQLDVIKSDGERAASSIHLMVAGLMLVMMMPGCVTAKKEPVEFGFEWRQGVEAALELPVEQVRPDPAHEEIIEAELRRVFRE